VSSERLTHVILLSFWIALVIWISDSFSPHFSPHFLPHFLPLSISFTYFYIIVIILFPDYRDRFRVQNLQHPKSLSAWITAIMVYVGISVI
jgi:hypothetical protein